MRDDDGSQRTAPGRLDRLEFGRIRKCVVVHGDVGGVEPSRRALSETQKLPRPRPK
jgi:hypothetical protein